MENFEKRSFVAFSVIAITIALVFYFKFGFGRTITMVILFVACVLLFLLLDLGLSSIWPDKWENKDGRCPRCKTDMEVTIKDGYITPECPKCHYRK